MNKQYSIDFREPKTVEELANYIGIDTKLFKKVITSKDRKDFYLPHRIPKRNSYRLFRRVWESPNILASAHKSVARRFELFVRLVDTDFPNDSAYGYVRHRGTKDNAKIHCGATLLLRADISDFFESISINRLIEKFDELGMHPKAGRALAKFLTIDDYLPLGLNASPMIANLVCQKLDNKIQALAERLDCKYTRYADDITISGNNKLPTRQDLEKILNEEKFKLSQKKFRITKLGQAHYVTGLSVSDKVPHAPRSMKRRLRQELHYCKKFGIREHLKHIRIGKIQSGINRIDGTVNYVGHIENSIPYNFKYEWNSLLERDGEEVSYDSLSLNLSHRVNCYVDESEIVFGNKKFLALGLVFTDNHNEILTSTISTLREHQVDPFSAGDKRALNKNGLHFTDSHPDLRTAYIKRLSNLNYRAFIIFGTLESTKKYQETYINLLQKILPKRLMWYDGANLRIIFEENSKIKSSVIEKAVDQVYKSLEKVNNRRPIKSPEVIIGKKTDHACFSVPDYLLAIFSRFAQFNEKKEEVRQHQFERLRDKYRLIIDADSNTEFSRRNPFNPFKV